MDKKPDIWMPMYIGLYLADTMHLTTAQHGAYILLLLHGWRNMGKIADDDKLLAQITRLPMDQWKAMRPVLEKFFMRTHDETLGSVWTQKRQLIELKKAQQEKAAKHKRASVAAKTRWRVKTRDAPSIAQALLKQCPSPSPSLLSEGTGGPALSGADPPSENPPPEIPPSDPASPPSLREIVNDILVKRATARAASTDGTGSGVDGP